MTGHKLEPIFVHSLFRAGSTYLFNVFRRSASGYWCYQEPLHEVAIFAKVNREALFICDDNVKHLRHPVLDGSYFRELYEVADQCLEHLREESIYDAYFAQEGADFGAEYWRVLIDAAHGRPMIQECRTSCRIGAIRSALGGFHIYLWRNPWDQWWSYKVGKYFDATSQMFINAPFYPEVISRLKREINFVGCERASISDQMTWFMERPLSPEKNYLTFYLLWCLGLLSGLDHADLMLNIDCLSDTPEYREEILGKLERNGITGLDFSDCTSPQAIYGDSDDSFFLPIEDKVHGIFLLSGIPQARLDRLIALRRYHKLRDRKFSLIDAALPELLRDAARARALVINAEDYVAVLGEKIRDSALQLERQTVACEAEAQKAETRVQQAEARAIQAETRVQQAEVKADELNQSSHHWWLEAERLKQQLLAVSSSTSWAITGPLRTFSQFVRWFFNLQLKFTPMIVHLPKRFVRWSLMIATSIVVKHPTLKMIVSQLLKRFPKINSKIRELAMARGLLISKSQYSPKDYSEVKEMLQATSLEDQLNIGEHSSDIVIDQNKRIILFYVEHTALFHRVTGVQRVCHNLSSSLANNINVTVILVKLDASTLDICPLNLEERTKFVNFSGHKISPSESRCYDPAYFKSLVRSLKRHPRKHWLVIPEVTYHSVHVPPPTSRVIKLARDFGLKVGVIFYDMIPLITGDASSNAQKHMNYISDISLADVIWPISHYASKGLVDYLWHNEKLSSNQFPVVSANALPEEKNGERVLPNPREGHSNILCLGTIDERKNQITLIRAFNEYCKSNPNSKWKLQIVGLVRDEYKRIIENECLKNPYIELNYSASDREIDSLFQKAAFTVFPSVEEGYGLPIVESLWHMRPCICANFGSMKELSMEGGCLTVDVRRVDELVTALTELIQNEDIYKEKISEILERKVKTWHEYAECILRDMDQHQNGTRCTGQIYYWVDATLVATGNTGIQRVNRQLAKHLIQQGHRLVPLKWNDGLNTIDIATSDELEYLERWNGPRRNGWCLEFDLEKDSEDASYLMVDLPLNRPLDVQQRVIDTFKSRQIRCAAIFYDAIPYKLANIYPTNFINAHIEYMTMLDQMDSVFSISKTSNSDLLDFIKTTSMRGLLLEQRLIPVALPAEFPVRKRSGNSMHQRSGICTILTVGTVEPRKNHIGLLKAFLVAEKQSQRELRLVIVGSSDMFDHELPGKVEALVKQSKNIVWIKNANDEILEQKYSEADFTIFPSVEEGFGLPIVESLWFGCPCICANFGQMAELAVGGGCLTVDVKNTGSFSDAVILLANDQDYYQKLKLQITRRYFKTWDDYASEISFCIKNLHSNKKPEYRKGAGCANYKLPPRPLLSVCITTYERADWLELTIENFIEIARHLGQQVELVVCDNCSSTSVASIFSKYQHYDQIAIYRNGANIGMLGNLPQTVSLARGDYVWLIGDDDIIHQGSLEKIVEIIQSKEPELINLNYAYATDAKPPKKENLHRYLKTATTICGGSAAHEGLVKAISCYNENFYTAIYSFVVKRSCAWRIYSQDTSGMPFSSLQTCVPTTKYILSNMMEAKGYWVSEPLITVNLNVSWGRYAPLWILERIPEVYDFAEFNGIPTNEVDQWRKHTLRNTLKFLEMIFESENPELYKQFDIVRFIRSYRHLGEFDELLPRVEAIYKNAFEQKNPLAILSPERLRGFYHG